MKLITTFLVLLALCFAGCQQSPNDERIKILIDTDANNELDDQHALAYAFINTDVFDIVGVTVNNTYNGNGIQGQYDEARRILTLFNQLDRVPLLKGATGNYEQIVSNLHNDDFDGKAAVDFIIDQAMKVEGGKLVLVPVGKLTNIALAIEKAPEIVDRIKIVWMGSNYPDPGEYNLANDPSSVNPVIDSGVEFEVVPARYGKPTASDAVRVTPEEIELNMTAKGPLAETSITGRNGGTFNRFGDYSVNLFSHIDLHGNPPSRAMFDMVALAVQKNPAWGVATEIPAPDLLGESWTAGTDKSHTIIIWDKFDRDGIIQDFFNRMEEVSD